MIWWRKVDALLRRCVCALHQCETRLVQIQRKDELLAGKYDGIERQCSAIQGLLRDAYLQGCTLDRAGLFDFQRRQAVLRRQLQELELLRAGIEAERAELQQKMAAELHVRRNAMIRRDRYENWLDRQRRERRTAQLNREEVEIEEQTTWRR
ncbi:hypothetical protein [Burkholderia ubonensis]|uniref:hypothetical protein n=1 Tax=Burkholderia ubonensis TaxID=101571 RepID=UPI0007587574|nr:hypothetical protein [Burkholderia ubonensis]KVN41166.1 hypothetical protein WJ64_32715 [Burkholderia ubonensis]